MFHRRSSLSIFRHKSDSPTPILTTVPPLDTSVHREFEGNDDGNESPKHGRPRTLQKSSRNSMFGSLRSLQSLEDDEKMIRSTSKASMHEDEISSSDPRFQGLFGKTVLHFGEVQTAGTFRRRNQFLVLTESHIIRFKSQSKATEMFPSIPTGFSKGHNNRGSLTSIGSHETHASSFSEITSGIALDQVVAVYKLDDGRPYFSIEISHMDEHSNRASCMQLALNEPRETDAWLTALRAAVAQVSIKRTSELRPSTLEYVARMLSRDRDYDPDHFKVFKVSQRASHRSAGRSSSDDLGKLNSTVCYLSIGVNKLHLVPLHRSSNRSSSSSLTDIDTPMSYGIVTLTSLALQSGEDALQLTFKAPLQNQFIIHLASSAALDIAMCLRYASEYLRPEWLRQPYMLSMPREAEDRMDPPNYPEDEHQCFDRTLIAYCSAYGVETNGICYSVDYQCEDAPCFLLVPRADSAYSVLELLAVFKSLRYNESFTSISFAGIDLNPLRHMYDPQGTDIDSLTTRSGNSINLNGHLDLPLLLQEIRGLALKSRRLRRLDFSHCLPKTKRQDSRDFCGIPEALVPLCKRSLTNVDWITLNGIPLTDTDVDHLVDAASERKCHLRALEIGDCGLAVHDVDVLLSTLAVHEGTLEVINIAGAQGRFSPELFQRQIGYFAHIRRLNLTRVQKTAGNEPLILPETLMAWRLESLLLSQTVMNEQTVDSISAYLASPRSDTLRELHFDQCGITGRDLAIFFQSMSREAGRPRGMHVSANENRLKIGYSLLFKTIAQNFGPTRLTMRMIDFEKERHFRELVEALTTNTTLTQLDISKASLPYDASEETCIALSKMFAENTTLRELDISGEHAHLDSARFGIGLNLALKGLEKNNKLEVLKIEHQNLGLQGAETLAELLAVNKTLVEIHCENNDINLQSFTVLVNALQQNTTLLYLPTLEKDREASLEKVKREISAMERLDEETTPTKSSALKRSFTGAMSIGSKSHRMSMRSNTSELSQGSFTHHDVVAAIAALNEKWDQQVGRLQSYLQRNYCRANGLPWGDERDLNLEAGGGVRVELPRPETAESLNTMLQKVQLDRTPTLERSQSQGFGWEENVGEQRKGSAEAKFTLPED
jgi:hypothetical protein